MPDLSRSLRCYIGGVAIVAVVSISGALALRDHPVHGLGLAWLSLVGAIVICGRFPVHLMAKTNLSLDGASLVAAALLCDPACAMIAAMTGVGLAQVSQRRSTAEVVFNTTQSVLWVGAGSTIFQFLAAKAVAPAPAKLATIGAIVAAVALMHGVNTLVIAIAGALQMRIDPLAWWWSTLRLDLAEQGLQAVIGTGTALLVWQVPRVAPGVLLGVVVLMMLGRRWLTERARLVPGAWQSPTAAR